MSDDIAASPTDAAPEHFLVEIAPGFGVLFGPSVPDGFEMLQSPILPDRATDDIWSTVSPLIGVANLAAQANLAHSSAQGLVRLTPQTLEALKVARPLMSEGQNLGVLVSRSGKFSHVVRWIPAGDVATSVQSASIGTALALLAIQAQLAEMKNLMQDNLQLTKAVLKELRNERWASASALRETLGHALDEAQAIGAVTNGVWQNIAGLEERLLKERNRDRRAVDDHIKTLAGLKSHIERQKFLAEHGDAILGDLISLIGVQQAWFIYQGLRAGHIYQGDEAKQADDALLTHIVRHAEEDWKRSTSNVYELAATLHEQFASFATFPGNSTMPVGRAHGAKKKVPEASREFLARLKVLEKEIGYKAPETPKASVLLIDKTDKLALLSESLRWRLEDTEVLLSLAIGDARGAFSGDRYLAVTDQRLLVGKVSDVDRRGGPWHAFSAHDVRYVKYTADKKWSTVTLDVYMPDDELHLKFELQTDSESARPDMEKLIELLQSFMNLPSAEVPQSPLLTTAPENTQGALEPARSTEPAGS